MADCFNWLHLTDLHVGQTDYDLLWSGIEPAFHEDLARVCEKCGPFHAVLFTGDLVMSGLDDQYEELEKFLSKLWERLGTLDSGNAVLLAVPGNHDLARPPANLPAVKLLLDKRHFSSIETSGFWDKNKPENEYRKTVEDCFNAYTKWWNKTDYKKRENTDIKEDGMLPGDFAATIRVGEQKIGIVGLNTTFLQLDAGNFKGKLSLHLRQLSKVCGNINQYVENHNACLLLTHQGYDWLSKTGQYSYVEINPAGRFAAHLFGHMHETTFLTTISAGGKPQRLWQACSLSGIEKYETYKRGKKDKRSHGYLAGSILFNNDNIKIRCWPRKAFHPDLNPWHMERDNERGQLEEDGGLPPEEVKRLKIIRQPIPMPQAESSSVQPSNHTGRLDTSPKPKPRTDENRLPFYKGLQPYGPEDSEHFFGRRKETRELIGLISPSVQMLHIRGASGVGKSSLVLARLLPKLGKTKDGMPWDSLAFKPDSDPFLSLARALNTRKYGADILDDGACKNWADQMYRNNQDFTDSLTNGIKLRSETARRVLYIDQLEELLVQSPSDTEEPRVRRYKFAECLSKYLKADSKNLLITSIRTDRDDLRDLPEWNALRIMINQGRQYSVVVPDDVEGISKIVRGPARLAKFGVEYTLIMALRTDVKGLTNWTPLLSAALQDIVKHWDRLPAPRERRLTLGLYQAIGGLDALIERRAKAVTEWLTDKQRNEVLPQIFSLLVDDKGRPTKRQYASFTELPSTARELLDQLVSARLLVAEGGVEIHDILFDRWKALSEWIKTKREDLDELSDLKHQAKRWLRRGRHKTDLLGKNRIEYAESVLKRHPLRTEELPILKDFVADSRTLLDQEALKAAITNGEILDVYQLLLRKVTLSEEQIASLGEQKVFYYSLFPDRIPVGQTAEGTGTMSMSTAEGFREVSEIGASISQVRLDFFNEDNFDRHVNKKFMVQHFAALAGHVDLLVHFKALGSDMSEPSDDRADALTLAAYGGQLQALKWLAKNSTSPKDALTNTRGKYNRSPIHWAALMGQGEIVQYLIEQGANVDEIDGEGYSVLDLAAYSGNPEVVKILLNRVADPGRRGPDGNTPLQLAIVHDKWGSVRSLFENMAAERLRVNNISEDGWTALGGAIAREKLDSDMVQQVPAVTRSAPIKAAREIIDFDVVQRLLTAGADPNQGVGEAKMPPLILATIWGHKSVVDLLIEKQADVNLPERSGRTALHYAVMKGQHDILKSLLTGSTVEIDSPDIDGMTPLFHAARTGEEEMVTALLDKKAKADRNLGGRAFILEAAFQDADAETRVTRGRIAERLYAAGAPMPAWRQFSHDDSGRIIGLQSIPESELHEWFLNRLPTVTQEFDLQIPPLIVGPWSILDRTASARILARFAGTSDSHAGPLKTVEIGGVKATPFGIYSDGCLYEVSVRGDDGLQGYVTFLETAKGFISIDGKSAQIHALNKEQHLSLETAPDAATYLRFFCSSLNGEEGTFRIFEGVQYLLPLGNPGKAEEDAQLRAAPLKFASEGQDEGEPFFMFGATVKYSNAIFETKFKVHQNGLVEMLEDTAVVENLNVYTEIFNDGIRTIQARSKKIGEGTEKSASPEDSE